MKKITSVLLLIISLNIHGMARLGRQEDQKSQQVPTLQGGQARRFDTINGICAGLSLYLGGYTLMGCIGFGAAHAAKHYFNATNS